MRRSISFRLTCWFSAIFLAGFVVFGIVMWLDLAWQLGSGRDRTLTRRANRCAEVFTARKHDSERLAAKFEEFTDATPEGNLIHVYDERGTLLFPLAPNPADFPWTPLSRAVGDHFANAVYQGHHYRILTRNVVINSRPMAIQVAGQLEDNRQLLARFQAGLEAATPALLILSALCGYFLSRRVLAPVDQLTTAVRSITIGNLSGRLPIYPTGDELQRLTETCNDMLARLENAVSRINRFTADASHELRNPIAFTRTVTEYALHHHNLDEDTRRVFEDILAESLEAGRLLEDMLMLARADAGRLEVALEPLDLRELLEEVCDKFGALADAKRQSLETRIGSGRAILIAGDRSKIRRLLWTLLDNAVKYTPEGGRIEVVLRPDAQQVHVLVQDSGVGIPKEMLPRIFERFFRADPSRGQSDGTGLGLAIAKGIADAHHATITAQSTAGEGTVFEVIFQTLAPESSVGAIWCTAPLERT